ncbi:MAG TPA: DUF5916 domain-containing protein [Bacteroidales bacterium]|nr:DUF5916 domain-containing protein [Bacteroidales bacterium]
MRRFLIILPALLLFAFNTLFAQPEIKAVYTESAPLIDGYVNDDVWKQAPVIDELYQREPNTGKAATKKSEFYFLYDHHNIYIGIRCYDDPETISSKELSRDGDLGEEDRIQVIFDTYMDGRSGYWFQIGPRGSIGDALVNENGKEFNKSWDGLWDGKAKITEYGWEGELIIPFKTMGFKKDNDTWGLKIIRYIKRISEISTWPLTSLNANRFQISDAGHITGISNITQGIGLDIVPYLTGGFSKKQDGDSKPVLDGGGDIFYNITPALKAAVTVNTDFAQTEVDSRQINLTRFNLFFPEKRDFFLDGSNYFTFGINGDSENPQNTANIPFFSRRIGLDTDGNPVQIKYGGKFTGKTDGWNLGMLHVKDNNEWKNPGYTVARISRDLGKQSSIGIIGTNGNALSAGDNSLAGIDMRLASSEVAGNKNITYNLYGIKSFTDSLSGRDVSFGTDLNFPNDFLNFRVGYLQIGENYTAGLGFVPRKGIRDYYGGIGLGPRPKNSPVMQIKTGVKYTFITDLHNGGLETAQIDLNYSDIILLSGDRISFSSQYVYESLKEDFNIFGEHTIVADNYNFWRHSVQVTSAKRRLFWLSTKAAVGGFYSGDRTDWLIQAGYKVAVPLYIGVESDRKWVNLPGGSFVAQIYRFNLNFMFSPNLTWYNFAQYENQSETIGLQSRFQWIVKPGKELFLTFNSPLIDPVERFQPASYEARSKVKYTIRF